VQLIATRHDYHATETMVTKKKKAILVVALVTVLSISIAVQLYFVADHAGVTVFARDREAYLFLGGGHTGWHFPALLFPIVVAQAYLGVPARISDKDPQSLVIRITPEGVQSWIHPASDVADLTPFQEGFYARCPGSVLCKWTEKGFMRASLEEEKSIAIDKLHSGSFDNKLVNGWNTYVLKFAPGNRFKVTLPTDIEILVQNHCKQDCAYPDVTVDLFRPGRAPENLYRADASPRLVRKSRYKELFPSH
jgi:hypothetical protein